MSELERLRADQEVLERYFCDGCAKVVRDKIAALEAEAADPWREAKEAIPLHMESGGHKVKAVARYARHLEAENARLTKRVAELDKEPEFTPAVLKRAEEIEIGDVILASGLIRTVTEFDGGHPNRRIIGCDGWMAWFGNHELIAVIRKPLVEAKTVADMQPPFEGPIVGIEPMLDPARVLATAVDMLRALGGHWQAANVRAVWKYSDYSILAKPYRLKGTDE